MSYYGRFDVDMTNGRVYDLYLSRMDPLPQNELTQEEVNERRGWAATCVPLILSTTPRTQICPSAIQIPCYRSVCYPRYYHLIQLLSVQDRVRLKPRKKGAFHLPCLHGIPFARMPRRSNSESATSKTSQGPVLLEHGLM